MGPIGPLDAYSVCGSQYANTFIFFLTMIFVQALQSLEASMY